MGAVATVFVFVFVRDLKKTREDAQKLYNGAEQYSNKVKNDVDSLMSKINKQAKEIELIKQKTELRELKDSNSMEFLNRYLGYGRRTMEETEKVKFIIEKLDQLKGTDYKENSYDMYMRGVSDFYNNKFESALKYFDDAIKFNKQTFFHQAYDAKANCYFQFNNLVKGKETAFEILRVKPDDPKALTMVYFCHKKEKEFNNATQILEKIKTTDIITYKCEKTIIEILNNDLQSDFILEIPTDKCNNSKGIYFLYKKKYKEALENFDKSLLKMESILKLELTNSDENTTKLTMARVKLNIAFCHFTLKSEDRIFLVKELIKEAVAESNDFKYKRGIDKLNDQHNLFINDFEVENWQKLYEEYL